METLNHSKRVRLPVYCIPERAIQTAEDVIAGKIHLHEDCTGKKIRYNELEEMAGTLLAFAKELNRLQKDLDTAIVMKK